MKKPAKKKTTAQLVEQAAKLLQRLVRLKAADFNGMANCVTCGRPGSWKELQGGHYIKRKWLATKLMEENIHPQCPYCNLPTGLDGNMPAYTLFMIDTYGREFVEYLNRKKHETKKFYRAEVLELIEELKHKCDEIQKEKGL